MTIDRELAEGIRLLVLDVDGVLTNAQLVLGRDGEEIKEFSVRDGIGIKLAQFAGIEVIFLSARESTIVEMRAKMLGVSEIYQGEQQKLTVLRGIAERHGVALDQVAYVGDDIVDMAPIRAVGVGVAVSDACLDVRNAASHVTSLPGGRGAVRETVDAILSARGDREDIVRGFLQSI
jgi:3-deoxy-D-manno-octulosonate 8-phosphate phosphatase (KDO 8-P phosphatase)